MKKNIYLEATVKGNYNHIRDIKKELFFNFWELMETVNFYFEIDNNVHINIIDDLVDLGNAIVGDYYITLDNQNADNLKLLNEAKNEMLDE